MQLFTASNTARAMACPGSVALPQTPDRTSEAAKLGTDVHAFLADALMTSRKEAVTRTNRPKVCERIDFDSIIGLIADGHPMPETAFAWVDGDNSEEHGMIGREYPELRDPAIWGTADLIICREPGAPVEVYDYKTGRSVGAANDNAQLKMLALVAAEMRNAHGVADGARIGIIYVDVRTGELSIDDAVLTAMDLDIFAFEVREAVARIEEAHADVAAGRLPVLNPSYESCKYCRAICEARAA